jgi:hypothetical protein
MSKQIGIAKKAVETADNTLYLSQRSRIAVKSLILKPSGKGKLPECIMLLIHDLSDENSK